METAIAVAPWGVLHGRGELHAIPQIHCALDYSPSPPAPPPLPAPTEPSPFWLRPSPPPSPSPPAEIARDYQRLLILGSFFAIIAGTSFALLVSTLRKRRYGQLGRYDPEERGGRRRKGGRARSPTRAGRGKHLQGKEQSRDQLGAARELRANGIA